MGGLSKASHLDTILRYCIEAAWGRILRAGLDVIVIKDVFWLGMRAISGYILAILFLFFSLFLELPVSDCQT
jgi:hypothetical protein